MKYFIAFLATLSMNAFGAAAPDTLDREMVRARTPLKTDQMWKTFSAEELESFSQFLQPTLAAEQTYEDFVHQGRFRHILPKAARYLQAFFQDLTEVIDQEKYLSEWLEGALYYQEGPAEKYEEAKGEYAPFLPFEKMNLLKLGTHIPLSDGTQLTIFRWIELHEAHLPFKKLCTFYEVHHNLLGKAEKIHAVLEEARKKKAVLDKWSINLARSLYHPIKHLLT